MTEDFEKLNFWKGFGIGGSLLGFIGISAVRLFDSFVYKQFPLKEVEKGYASPKCLEIIVKDLNAIDKKPETYVTYKGKKYALLDDGKNLRLQEYTLEPQKVILKKE